MIQICKYYVLVCLLFFSCLSVVNGQKESNIWYFGNNAGLDFNQGFPIPLSDGKLDTWEGCASISDADGNLLFYTEGENVWNKEHMLMPNGKYLLGHESSTQSAIIVPHPGKADIYYLFTVPADRQLASLRYSIVDLKLNNGLGDIDYLNKNVAILPAETLVTEKLTAVKHADNKSYWIIAHQYGNDSFFSFLIDSTGINTEYVISEIGSRHTEGISGSAMGYMKASPKGNKVAVAIQSLNIVELFDFDNSTGKLSNHLLLSNKIESAYGVEFSPNERFLYCSLRRSNTVLQWDLNEEDISGSETIIGETPTPSGALQTGPDGSIYLASQGNKFIHIIHLPNRKGENCNFQVDGLFLGGKKSREGLPNFIASFNTESSFRARNFCIEDTTIFSIINTEFIDSVLWNFDDPEAPAPVFTTSLQDTSYIFPRSGSYDITLMAVFIDGKIDTIKQTIYVSDYPVPMLVKDTSFCEGTPLILNAGGNDECLYFWDNQSTEQYLNVTESGIYSVMISLYGCIVSDSTMVDIIPGPKIYNKTVLESECINNTGEIHLEIEGGSGEYSVIWDTDPQITGPDITAIGSGLYIVSITDINTSCIFHDSIIVNNPNGPDINIEASNNPSCFGESISFNALALNATKYLWNTGDTLSQIEFIAAEKKSFWVKGTDNEGCSSIETISLVVNPNPEINLDSIYEACVGQEIIIEAGGNYDVYSWNTNSANSSIIVRSPGEYSVAVTNSFGCTSIFETTVIFNYSPIFDLGRDTVICKGLSVNLNAGNWLRYNWNTGDRQSEITVTETGNYIVNVTGQNSCEGTDEIYIQVNDPENLQIDNVEPFDINCGGENDGILKINGYGSSAPLLYSIDGGLTYYNNKGVFRGLSPNISYSVAIKEEGACIRKGQSYILTEPPVLNINSRIIQPSCPGCSDGNITLLVNGGVPPYSFFWSNYKTGNTRYNIPEGFYSAKISDANNCSKVFSTKLLFDEKTFLDIPTAFTPNNDGINDLWQIANTDNYFNMIVIIYNSSGKKIYESIPGYPEPWDGTFNGKSLPVGSYYYIIDTKKGDELLKGTVTIIK